jgi:hypothetical protein
MKLSARLKVNTMFTALCDRREGSKIKPSQGHRCRSEDSLFVLVFQRRIKLDKRDLANWPTKATRLALADKRKKPEVYLLE